MIRRVYIAEEDDEEEMWGDVEWEERKGKKETCKSRWLMRISNRKSSIAKPILLATVGSVRKRQQSS